MKGRGRQQGYVLISIMTIMALISVFASVMFTHCFAEEQSAINESLAKIRVFWAEMGMTSYALSRAKKAAVIVADNDKKIKIISYIEELPNLADADGREVAKLPVAGVQAMRWAYPDYGQGYIFDMDYAIEDIDASDTGRIKILFKQKDPAASGGAPSF